MATFDEIENQLNIALEKLGEAEVEEIGRNKEGVEDIE